MAYFQMDDDEQLRRIMEFEGGNLTYQEFIEFFSYLIGTEKAWSLQGFYGRTAAGLIDEGMITKTGEITEEAKKKYWGKKMYIYDS